MPIINARFDTDQINLSLEELKKIIPQEYWSIEKPYPTHFRNMLDGWEYLGKLNDWKQYSKLPIMQEPGTYALVMGGKEIINPILVNRMITIGETAVHYKQRLPHHVGAFNGKITNTSGKFQATKHLIDEHFGVTVTPDMVSIFVRPHKVSDPEWKNDRTHSSAMETQAQACYQALFGYHAPGNTRDLPKEQHKAEARKYLKDLGYKVSH